MRFVGRHDEPHYTYREIAERALEVAGALRTLGVEPSDRVAIAVPSSLAFYEVFFGALFAGAVPAVFQEPRRLGSRSDEPIWKDGAVVGFVTSGGYAHYVEKSVALGFVPTGMIADGASFEIEILGEMRPAALITEPLFDPKGERMRG